VIESWPTGFVHTVKERCRVCYTCVRECPAKAIRIADGQAEVMAERCISCGNCVRICSQKAKEVVSSISQVKDLLHSKAKVAVCLAPSFPAEFVDMEYPALVAGLRCLGFHYVNEVGFGADLVARKYKELLEDIPKNRQYISSTCPAIIGYVEKYYPHLVSSLIPVVSPMLATARVLHRLHGKDLKIVFVGPCIAKKCESLSENTPDEIDAVLTFSELRQMLSEANLDPAQIKPSEFDPPYAGLGSLFSISRGLLQAAQIKEDLMAGDVVVTDGRTNFVDAIREFENGNLDARLLEILACNGCIMGAGMTTETPLFSRRSQISSYVRKKIARNNLHIWKKAVQDFSDLDLTRHFTPNDQRIPVPFEEEISYIMSKMGKRKPQDELNCGACGYDTCREHAVAIFKGLAESEMCLPHTIEQLRMTVSELANSNEQLANTREALMQSEKLASMGQLAAGIAHEVNNPLGVVLMYSHLLLERFGKEPQMSEDLKLIVEQTDRCKKIVSQLLHFARQNKVQLQKTDIGKLIERILQVLPSPPGITVTLTNEIADPLVEVDPDQITQVLTNLINNAYSAMPQGGSLRIGIFDSGRRFKIEVADQGNGIPPENLGKIFEPFFTTKEIGKGTGLGLAVAYGIIKMHRGDIQVESNADPNAGPTGTKFSVLLPKEGSK
jgi:iron only hydrogenase large subunit-like protein/nitrogen-specific signal transduction histidine kinase